MPAFFALGWIAVSPLAAVLPLAGCQSGAQQDLVARELRMHEDQIYAMEDYIAQYQQLVCKYRSENAALRKQLADEYYDAGDLPAPRQAPRADGEQTTPPGGEGQPPPSRDIEIELPEVPPLEGSTSNDLPLSEVIGALYHEPAVTDSGEVASGSGEVDSSERKVEDIHSVAEKRNLAAKSPGLARAQKFIEQTKELLRLHGEVVASDPGAGPRLVVNVESVDDAENGGAFEGEASLMLLAPARPQSQQALARWDFGPQDVLLAKEDAGDTRAMRFYLELPPDTPIDQPTELWARLVPHSGDKLLAHTNVDLAVPGGFASSTEPNQTASDDPSVAALASAGAASMPASFSASVAEGDWSIARPGEPANLPSAEEILTGGWRTSSEPLAVVAQANAIAKPQPRAVQQAHYVEDGSETKPAPVYKAPTWSPERSHDLPARSDEDAASDLSPSGLPAWSATR